MKLQHWKTVYVGNKDSKKNTTQTESRCSEGIMFPNAGKRRHGEFAVDLSRFWPLNQSRFIFSLRQKKKQHIWKPHNICVFTVGPVTERKVWRVTRAESCCFSTSSMERFSVFHPSGRAFRGPSSTALFRCSVASFASFVFRLQWEVVSIRKLQRYSLSAPPDPPAFMGLFVFCFF